MEIVIELISSHLIDPQSVRATAPERRNARKARVIRSARLRVAESELPAVAAAARVHVAVAQQRERVVPAGRNLFSNVSRKEQRTNREVKTQS